MPGTDAYNSQFWNAEPSRRSGGRRWGRGLRPLSAIFALIALLSTVALPMSSSVAVPYDTLDLDSPTHPSQTTWYADDSPEFTWESEPLAEVRGSVDTTGRAYDIDFAGDYAFIADGDGGLKVVDISSLDAPTVLASVATSGSAYSIDVCGDYAFLAGRGDGFHVVNISEPGTPTVVGWTDTPDTAWSLTVEGHYAFVADNSSVQVVDVSDPTSPTIVGSRASTGIVEDTDVSGDVLYVGESSAGFRTYDISDPTAPTPLGDSGTAARHIVVDGENAFATRGGSVDVLDVSDPTSPTVVGSVEADTSGLGSFSVRDVAVSGDRVYAVCTGAGVADRDFQLLDVSDVANPVVLDTVDVSSNPYRVAAFDGHALVANDWDGLAVVELWEPGVPAGGGTFDTGGEARAVDVQGDYAYFADYGKRLTIADISDPANPTLAATLNQNFAVEDIVARGAEAFCAAAGGGLTIFDISDPTAPSVKGSVDSTGSSRGVDVQGDLAITADGGQGIQVFDISDPSAPTTMGSTAAKDNARRVELCGPYAYVADDNEGLSVVDVSDPDAPTIVGNQKMPSDEAIWDVTVAGRIAYVAGDDGVHSVDISDPKDPAVVDSLQLTGTVYGMDLAGDTLFGAARVGNWDTDDAGALYVIDVTDPSNLVLLETADTRRHGRDVAVAGEMAYVANDRPESTYRGDSGLDVLSWGGPAGYSYVFDRSQAAVPDSTVDVTTPMKGFSGVADGEWWFTVQAISRSGDIGQKTQRRIKIDTTPPTTTSDAESSYSDEAMVELSATDAGIGVDKTYYILDGGAEREYAGPISVTAFGDHSLEFWSEDQLGNVEAKNTADFTVVASAATFVEIAGPTRYETAIEVSKRSFPDGGADTVIIATGENWPDALGGAALAGAYDAPILLTPAASVPQTVMDEIGRLGATEAIILGGPGAVTPAVETGLAGKLGATSVTRIGGATRYETAELIARAVANADGPEFDGTCFVATGLNFPDSLAGSPLAAGYAWPIFLAPATGLTPSTLATMSQIGVDEVLILGGIGVVSQAVEDGLAAGLGADNVTRLAGRDRYETAFAVSCWAVMDMQLLGCDKIALATGENFPDALAGGVLQGKDLAPLLLTRTDSLPPAVASGLEQQKEHIGTLRYLGGPGAISPAVRAEVAQILQ